MVNLFIASMRPLVLHRLCVGGLQLTKEMKLDEAVPVGDAVLPEEAPQAKALVTGHRRTSKTSRWQRSGFIWVALCSVPEVDIVAGDTLDGEIEGSAGDFFGVAVRSSMEIPVKLIRPTEMDGLAEDMAEAWKAADVTTPRADGTKDETPAVEVGDVRTIACKYDEDWERRRDFSEAVGLMHEEEFSLAEFPSEAPRVAHWWLKDLKRSSSSPALHHNTWGFESHVSKDDRTWHEHLCLCEAIEAFACIGQLNCSSLWGFEILVRRIMLLEEAHAPGHGGWEGAEFWQDGTRRVGGVRIAPAMQKYVASKQHERNAIQKEKRKAKEHRGPKPPTNPANKGGGRGDGGGKG